MRTKVLFAYNGRVEVDENGNYYGNELNDILVDRYLNFGKEVVFLVRLKPIKNSEIKGLMPFVNKHLTIVGVPDFSSPSKFLKNSGRVKEIIRSKVKEADVVVSRLPSLIGREAINESRRLNKPYLVEVVGCPWDALYNHSFMGKVYAPYAFMKLKNQVKDSPFVLYVTTQFLQNRYPSQGETTGVTDVVLDTMNEKVLANRIAKIRNRDTNKPLLIGTAAGYDVKFKGQEYVIRALAILKKQNIIFHYQPVGKGTGERLASIAKHLGVENQLTLPGQLKHSEVFEYLDNIDLYIQPSKQEGLPRSVVEAMSRACPVLGSDTGGIPELIEPNYIFGKGKVKEIVKILSGLNNQILESLAKRDFEFSKQFETKVMDDKRMEFYNRFKASYLNE